MVNLLLGCTGSVASVKIPLLVQALFEEARRGEYPLAIKIVTTEPALHFFDLEHEILRTHNVPVLRDADEYLRWGKMGDEVLHIELRNWADIMVIAPLSANTLAKAANGLCDGLLTCVLRAWHFTKPVFVAPAMNTAMYEHPITATQLQTLTSWGYQVIPPISKKLACGDFGTGAMAEYTDIARTIAAVMANMHTQ
ncbi:hypothetical protein GGF32_008764 [Allomyces javanicus]|nr:hypothetical protein GGF32_008764 [Allomyces javanicus]